MNNKLSIFNKWESFFNKIQKDNKKNVSIKLFHNLREHYEKLEYHNFNHINECLLLFQEFKNLCENPILVETAIWYHDVIYNIEKNDNEYQSAFFFEKEFSKINHIFIPQDIIKIKSLILATKHDNYQTNNDSRIICDIDLISGLSGHFSCFFEKSINIAEEYLKIVSDEKIFWDKRINFLKNIRGRKKFILYNKSMQNIHENNIINNIKSLEKIIPTYISSLTV